MVYAIFNDVLSTPASGFHFRKFNSTIYIDSIEIHISISLRLLVLLKLVYFTLYTIVILHITSTFTDAVIITVIIICLASEITYVENSIKDFIFAVFTVALPAQHVNVPLSAFHPAVPLILTKVLIL